MMLTILGIYIGGMFISAGLFMLGLRMLYRKPVTSTVVNLGLLCAAIWPVGIWVILWTYVEDILVPKLTVLLNKGYTK